MTASRNITTTHIDWRGITLEITYEPQWLHTGAGDPDARQTGHLQIRSVRPDRTPLPITETGYRSHFVHADYIERAGGPVAYATAWLEAIAAEKWWRDRETAARQFDLFRSARPR